MNSAADNTVSILIEVALEAAPAMSPARRILVYRAAATACGDESFAATLEARAAAIEQVERSCLELPLVYRASRTPCAK